MKYIRIGEKKITPRKIICVGKNYRAHIAEMGGSDVLSEPVLFFKPSSAIASGMGILDLPERLGLLHHEVELCFVMGATVKDVDVARAAGCISGYGVGLDFTLRDRQLKAKKAGLPWCLAKGFDGAAVFGDFIPSDMVGDPLNLSIELSVNGEKRQVSNSKKMLYSPADIISFASGFMTLEKGDVFMTGTPEGVGKVVDGDILEARIENLPPLDLIVRRK